MEKIYPHTIYMTVGPSGCGKTTFVKEFLSKNEEELKDFNVHHVSSDDIRRELLGKELDKYEIEMDNVSKPAFKLLMAKLDALTDYPVNAEVIFLDTTALSSSFRDEVSKLAIEKNYRLVPIIFNFKNPKEYYKFNPPKFVKSQIKRLQNSLKTFKPGGNYFKVIRVRDREELEFDFSPLKELSLSTLKEEEAYVIGDVHGCYEELIEAITSSGFEIEDGKVIPKEGKRIVLVGDYIDKGPEVKKVLNFLYHNEEILLVLGNHENFVYKYKKGLLDKDCVDPEVVNNYFTGVKEITGEWEEKFFALVERSHSFIKGKNFIITHAPCRKKFLGKLTREAIKAQRVFRYPHEKDYENHEDFVEALEESISFLNEEADKNQPFHFFGHIPSVKTLTLKNKRGIDLGCVEGGRLCVANVRGDRVKNKTIPSQQSKGKELPELFQESYVLSSVDFSMMEPREYRKLLHMAENKVNFVSGTMAPADKRDGELEVLEEALDYFKSKGVNRVTLQPKYMGSRATVYLGKTNEESYTSSRRGGLVKKLNLNPIYENLRGRLKHRFEAGAKMIVVDAELMPWRALGGGLIDREFKVVGTGISTELKLIKESGFNEALRTLREKMISEGYEGDKEVMKKKELVEKYTSRVNSTYSNALEFLKGYMSIEKEEELVKVYQDQLKLYGEDSELELKPFSILKVINEDDSEKLFFNYSNEKAFKELNDDPNWLTLDLSEEGAYEKAREFYEGITELMEGIVVKPADFMYKKGLALYRKVRNPRYLSIIYGYDYKNPKKYEALVNQKNVKNKLRNSIIQAELGKMMLEIPHKEIEISNTRYLEICANLLKEKTLAEGDDPRL